MNSDGDEVAVSVPRVRKTTAWPSALTSLTPVRTPRCLKSASRTAFHPRRRTARICPDADSVYGTPTILDGIRVCATATHAKARGPSGNGCPLGQDDSLARDNSLALVSDSQDASAQHLRSSKGSANQGL